MTSCYVCDSIRFVDEHHLDCARGRVSDETVPLCRRCHRTYHNWGIKAFSPDTLERGLEIENRRREIYGKPWLTLDDILHSRYWYKKWGIIRPGKKKALPVSRQLPLFEL